MNASMASFYYRKYRPLIMILDNEKNKSIFF
jgi:hypothetical protein